MVWGPDFIKLYFSVSAKLEFTILHLKICGSWVPSIALQAFQMSSHPSF